MKSSRNGNEADPATRVFESLTAYNGFPQLRWLDSVYVEVERKGHVVKRCFTDLTNEEQEAYLGSMDFEGVKELCILMAGAVRGIGDIYGLSFVGLEDE